LNSLKSNLLNFFPLPIKGIAGRPEGSCRLQTTMKALIQQNIQWIIWSKNLFKGQKDIAPSAGLQPQCGNCSQVSQYETQKLPQVLLSNQIDRFFFKVCLKSDILLLLLLYNGC